MNWKAFWDGHWEVWRNVGPYGLVFLAGFFLGFYLS